MSIQGGLKVCTSHTFLLNTFITEFMNNLFQQKLLLGLIFILQNVQHQDLKKQERAQDRAARRKSPTPMGIPRYLKQVINNHQVSFTLLISIGNSKELFEQKESGPLFIHCPEIEGMYYCFSLVLFY